ncbi:MAG: SDR family NAD(P)-dependent oxidoreductase [Alphaproteobacteria bacterium]|nr:SDR family NAD(P)-dependent oxidoreductase [Alphaproteobacteria bacterium]
MGEHIKGKVIAVTGAARGFGRLICEKAAAMGARIAAADIDEAELTAVASAVAASGGSIIARRADVTALQDTKALVEAAVTEFGALDVMINNAGVMPLAFFADHAAAERAWDRCIDINIKGTLNGIIAAHDQMIAQGRGHVINLSSIYGNYPVVGAGVYGATKAAVNFLSHALRVESQGRIKVTTIRPTGVPATNLSSGIVNMDAVVGILGQKAQTYLPELQAVASGQGNGARLDPNRMDYIALDPTFIADAVIHAIDQPWGVSLSDITVRASGDEYIL